MLGHSISRQIFLMNFLGKLIFPPMPAKSLFPKIFFALSSKFASLEKFSLPKKIFPLLKKEVKLDNIVKRAAQACQMGRVLDTPVLDKLLNLNFEV